MQRDPVRIPEHLHRLSLGQIDIFHRRVQLGNVFFFEFRRRLPCAQLGLRQNFFHARCADAVEGREQKLLQRTRIAFLEQFREGFQRYFLRGASAAIRQSHLDDKRVSAIDGRRTSSRAEELTRQLMMQSPENQPLADRRNTVACRRRDFRVLNCSVERVGFLASDAMRIGSRADLRGFADPLGHTRADARERRGEKLRHCSSVTAFQHGHELPEFDPIRMGFDLHRLRRKLGCRSRVCGFAAIRIDVVNGDVRVGNRGLLQIFVDAAAPTHIAALELDCHARTAPEVLRLLARTGIVRYPLNTVVGDVPVSLFAGRYIFAVALAVDDLRLVAPRINLNLEIVRRLFLRSHRDDLHRFARCEHPIHTRSTDADSLLAAAHP